MADYSIKDLERLSLVKAHTIRIWEKRYALFKPKRSATNIRTYSDADLRKLLNVAQLVQRGMRIARVARLSEAELGRAVLEPAAAGGYATEIDELVLAMMDLDQDMFEKVLSNAVLRMGFEQAMHRVLLPFLVRVGLLWQAGEVRPGQEHFISQIIRQKLIAAIDGLARPVRRGGKRLVLYLPEGEQHELGLLFACYIARKAGHKVIYLGQNVPLADLLAIAHRHRPDILVTAFLATRQPAAVQSYLQRVLKELRTVHIMVHMPPAARPERLPARVQVLADLHALEAQLA